MKKIYRSIVRSASVILLLLMALQATAQLRAVTGTVKDASGLALPGVNILLKGTTLGTTTDARGNFSIDAKSGDVLIISFIGYKSQEIAVGTQTSFNVLLEEDVATLTEVVVVGYGEMKKSDVTGAVASVSGETLRGTVVTNIDQALQGRVAGVQVTQNSGQPGGAVSIRIRGTNSIMGSNEPLYVIDGIPFQGDGAQVSGFEWAGGSNGQNRVNPLSTINPNDIESIEVLQDASATAIYGSRAANGVVMVTTKRGRKGESKLSYNGYYGVQRLYKRVDMMSLPEFAEYQNQIARELMETPNARYADPTLLGEGTNWQEEVFRSAPMQNHQISATGGTDKTQYAITGSMFKQDGIMIGTNLDRFTTRVNLDNQLKDWFKIGTSLTYANTTEKMIPNDGIDGILLNSLTMQPDVPVRDMNGNYAGPDNNNGTARFNPVSASLMRNNVLKRQRLMANIYADATIIKNLTFRTEIGLDDNNSQNKAFNPKFEWGALINPTAALRVRHEHNFFWIWKNYFTYNITLGNNHNISAMVGTEAQKSTYEGTVVTKRNITSNDVQELSQGDDKNTVTDGFKGAASLSSYFGRVNYNHKDRYLLTATLRADGSSKFGPENKWGYFPSFSARYRISNEPFFPTASPVSDLSLRVGYGVVGNQAIDDYLYGSALTTIRTPLGTGYRMSNIANPILKWESTAQLNIGLDLGLFDGRVNLTTNVYEKQTKDMLLPLSVPAYIGGQGWDDIKAPMINVGSMQNKGIDLTLNTVNVNTGKYAWNTTLTYSANRNVVKELASKNDQYYGAIDWYSEFQRATITRQGDPIGSFYGYVVEGIFENKDDILNHATQVLDPSTVSDTKPNGLNKVDKRDGVWIGDMKFKDLNNDGVINSDDQTIIGNPNPKFTYGINNSFKYGPFELNVYITGSYGAKILNFSRAIIEQQTSRFDNQSSAVVGRARYSLVDPLGSETDPDNVVLANPGTDMPRFATNDVNRNNRMSTRFIEDGSYVRIQNLSLAYVVPNAYIQRFRLQRLRVYANVQNIHTFTKYSGFDPEIGAYNQSALFQNIDRGRYPNPRTYTFGIDIDF